MYPYLHSLCIFVLCFILAKKGCSLYFAMVMTCRAVNLQNFCQKCVQMNPLLMLSRVCTLWYPEITHIFLFPKNCRSSHMFLSKLISSAIFSECSTFDRAVRLMLQPLCSGFLQRNAMNERSRGHSISVAHVKPLGGQCDISVEWWETDLWHGCLSR